MEPMMDGLDEATAQSEAEYTLEIPMTCGGCQERIRKVEVIRLLRTKVNFTSALPRRGYVVVCPNCNVALPAHLG